jgi:hypothetical protein
MKTDQQRMYDYWKTSSVEFSGQRSHRMAEDAFFLGLMAGCVITLILTIVLASL